MSLRTTVLTQQSEIRELQSADRRRQTMITEMLTADRRRQKQFTEALKLIKRQYGPAKGPAQPDAPKEAEMAPKRATRSNIAPETTNTTSVTNAQLQEMIDQGVTATLAARDANRSMNGDDSHNSGTGVRRTERPAREFENQVKFTTCTLHSVANIGGTTLKSEVVMMPLTICLGKHS
ncbi:hypothetical protein Tco_1403603 [Tanacetum coccineum]